MQSSASLGAAQRAKIRRLSSPPELSTDEGGGELNVVPYLDVIVNLLIFVIATLVVTFTASIDTQPPLAKPGLGSAGLNLTVLVVNEGFAIKAGGGNVTAGCDSVGPGLAIPKRGGAYDFEALRACAAKLKHSSSELGAEEQVFITANPNVDYQTIIGVVDAVRSGPSGESLFTDVNFRVPR